MRILLVNDDGIHSPGLRAMYDALLPMGDVQVVAPQVEQSGMSHRITYLHPIMVKEHHQKDGTHYGWAVDGSPADCTKMGVLEFCDGWPDLIVSGINTGANAGINVIYSGTVAAAIEGAFFGITSVAVSQSQGETADYSQTARQAAALIGQLLGKHPRQGSLWNINFPDFAPDWPRGVKVCPMGVRRHSDTVEQRTDPRGRPYYWSGLGPMPDHDLDPGSDAAELRAGYITVTPLHFDLTEKSVLNALESVEFSVE